MIDKNYNKKFQDFFKKFEKQYLKANENEKMFLIELAAIYVEKNRDFVMQYPIIQYWKNNKKEIIEKKELISAYSNKEINLYFHIPFCKTRCSYCNFHIVVGDKNKNLFKKMYFKKVKDEVIEFLKYNKNFKIKTIFIGGGTPSYLSEEELTDLLSFIKEKLSIFFKKNIEFSFEGNPDSFNENKLKILKNFGVNRLSIGVQTFNNEILKNINRTYTQDTVYNILQIAKNVGFDNINIDVLYGLPGHDYKIMKQDLEIVSKLDIEHVTYYPLYYYEESILSQIGKKRDNIKEIYDFYEEIIKTLNKKGFKQYGREYFTKKKIHNYQNNFVSNGLLYGFGLSAYSYNEKYAFVKEQKLDEYIKNDNNIIKYINYNNKLIDKRLFVLGTRNIKINKKNIKNIAYIQKIIKLPLKMGLIKENKSNYILTKIGLKYQELLSHMLL